MKDTAWWAADMSREAAAERLGDDVAEFVSMDGGGAPDLLKRIKESRQSRDGRELIHPDVRESGEMMQLSSSTKARVRRLRPGRRRRMVNAVLGAAIFATVSIAALATLNAPDSYIFAGGSVALGVIILAREVRSHV